MPNDLIREPADILAPPIDGPIPPFDGPVPPLPAMTPTSTITGSVYDTMDEYDLADNSVSYSTQASRIELEPAFDTEQQGHQWSMSPPIMTPRMVHAGGPSGATSPGLECPDKAVDTARSVYATKTYNGSGSRRRRFGMVSGHTPKQGGKG